ncbi:DUF7693 family protein [Pleionea sediminis]|uniref:DUF7693 family protein n=1 Tax=Pleionea sediminis TaxID=2569479 RepID=UPI001184A459|nr:hypothetical protein [Pleionea sediminis]
MSNDYISEKEIFTFLKRIESGEVELTPSLEPQRVYSGNVEYKASNGWKITIFSDANEWDYIDEVVTDEGRVTEYSMLETLPLINNYEPTREVSWRAYGIPGYCKFKCTICGDEFKYKKNDVYVCSRCNNKL